MIYSDHPTDLHLQKVWTKLEKLVQGQILEVRTEAPKFPELWITCVKMFMDCFKNVVEFNSDYSKVRKMNVINFGADSPDRRG